MSTQEEEDMLWLVQMEIRKIHDEMGQVTEDNPMGEIGLSMASPQSSPPVPSPPPLSSPQHVLATLTPEEEALQALISEKGTKYKSCVN